MKHFRFFTLTLLAVLAISALSGMAVAQSVVTVKFHLDEQLQWGKAVLTPGEYTMSINSLTSPMRGVLRASDGKTVAQTFATVIGDPISKETSLQVTGNGAERRVLTLNLPEFGLSAIYSSLTKGEREEMAKKKAPAGVAVAQR